MSSPLLPVFEDFEITILAEEPPSSGANVTVRYARGQRTGVLSLTAMAEAVAILTAALRSEHPPEALMMNAGAALFGNLFTGKVLEAWRDQWGVAHIQQHGVRLRLYSEIPSLMAVPWEYLYDSTQSRWLALQPDISLVRALPLASRQPLPIEGKLRVVVMVADPIDLPTLDSEREWANLQVIATTSNIELERITPTYSALLSALRQRPHIFHFIGHGVFDEARQQGMLALCGEDGRADFLPAAKLAALLGGHLTLRLVLLNACYGAQTGSSAAFAGLAQQLIRYELSAVIAMQSPIVDDHAVRFSEEFYAALADGFSVETAVGQGRKRINEVACSWGIPTLYFQGQEPFAIAPLSNVEKAVRLWQRSQDIPVADRPARRHLLERALKLDPTHVASAQALQRLTNDEKAEQFYATALGYYQQQQWREAYRILEKVEQLTANFGDTRSLLAEIAAKLDTSPPPPVPDQYQPLLNALREGRLVPFLGWDSNHFDRPPQTRWVRGKYLPSTDEVAHELATLLPNRMEGVLSLQQVAQYTTLLEGEAALYQRLQELYTCDQTADYPTTLLHRLLAELPGRLRAKGYPTNPDRRFVIFSTAFDDLLERAFTTVGQSYHLFTYHHRFIDSNGVTQHGRFFHTPPQGEPVEVTIPNAYNGHDGDRYPVIIKLCGQHITAEPDSVMVTEDHFLEYLPTQTVGELLPATLLRYVKGQSFVFFGYTLQPWHARLLWQRMRHQKIRLHGRSWAITPNPTQIEQEFWRNQDIVPLSLNPAAVIAYINIWLENLEPRR